MALAGLLITAVTTLVLAVPVVSGAREDRAPVTAGRTSSPAPAPARTAKTPPRIVMGVDGAPRSGSQEAPTPPSVGAGGDSGGAAPAPRVPDAGTRASAPEGVARQVPPIAPSAPSAPTGAPSRCTGPDRTVLAGASVAPAGVLNAEWKVSHPPADTTYDLTGVVSTAFPSSKHPFNTGTGTPGTRTCLIGGELQGTVDPGRSWEYYHDEHNAACVKVVAVEWAQIHGTRCAGVEDGFRPQEGGTNLNRTWFQISGTYLSDVADDCLENDYTLGGVLRDNLWESCFTGISERPSSANGTWTSPSDETLTLDRMLIGLRSMPHDSDKGTGPNALFKWSTSANKVVIRCSIFFVPQRSVNGTDTMAIPPGTVVDDSECPDNPSTIVWLGGGAYPAATAGMRVVSDRAVWTRAVDAWKAARGLS